MTSSATRQPARRVALVTGGTRGIGLGIAHALARDGWHLALCGLRPADRVEQIVSEIAAAGVDVHYTQADVADPQARTRLLSGSTAALGPINALINNAGRAPRVRADLLGPPSPISSSCCERSSRPLLPHAAGCPPARRTEIGEPRLPCRHCLHHIGLRRSRVNKPRRVLREQGRTQHGRAALCAATRA